MGYLLNIYIYIYRERERERERERGFPCYVCNAHSIEYDVINI